MKEIKETYEPVEENFRNTILDLIAKRKFVRLHYFNDYQEYISVTAIIKNIEQKLTGEFAILHNGDEIRLDKIVRLEGNAAPGYAPNDFSCDC